MEALQIHSSGVLVDEVIVGNEDEVDNQDHLITNLSFSFDGKYLVASCGARKYIWVFNLNNEFSLEGPLKITADNIVTSVAISSNFVCAGFIDGIIIIYDLKNIQLKKTLKEPNEWISVNSVKFSPDGTKILSGFGDGFVRLYDIAENSVLYEEKFTNFEIRSVCFSNLGKVFYATSSSKTRSKIYIINPPSFEIVDFKFRLDDLCMSPDSNYICGIGLKDRQNGFLVLFNTKQNFDSIVLYQPSGLLTSVSTDGEYICGCSSYEGLIFYKLNPKDFSRTDFISGNWGNSDNLKLKIGQAKEKIDIISCCAYSPDGKYLFLGGKKITKNLNPMAYWTPARHDELFQKNHSSAILTPIMSFFLLNDELKPKVPTMINNRIFEHFTYSDLLRRNPRFSSYNR